MYSPKIRGRLRSRQEVGWVWGWVRIWTRVWIWVKSGVRFGVGSDSGSGLRPGSGSTYGSVPGLVWSSPTLPFHHPTYQMLVDKTLNVAKIITSINPSTKIYAIQDQQKEKPEPDEDKNLLVKLNFIHLPYMLTQKPTMLSIKTHWNVLFLILAPISRIWTSQ